MKGLITNLKRMAIHDGAGLRTTVFFKGCPLRCLWCHNPDTLSFGQEVGFYAHKCIGCGICVRVGGAPSGDDALAMALSHKLRLPIAIVYLVSDLLVLGLSLLYIPPLRILYSLLTVILSGQLVGAVERIGRKDKQHAKLQHHRHRS